MATTTISGTTDVEDLYLYSSSAAINTGGSTNIHALTAANYDYYGNYAGFVHQSNVLIRCKKGAIPAGTISVLRLYTGAASGVAPTPSIDGATAWLVKDSNTWVEGTVSGAQQTGSTCWDKLIYNTTNWAGSQGCNTAGTDYYNATSHTVYTNTLTTLTAQWATDWRDSVVPDNGVVIIPPLSGFPATGTPDSTVVYGINTKSTESASGQPYWEVDYTAGGVSAFISRPSPFSSRRVVCR